jgi:hypothetical protein
MRSRAKRLIGCSGSSSTSLPSTIGMASSSSATRSRIMRDLPWPRSPRKIMSCPARIACSTAGTTVSL